MGRVMRALELFFSTVERGWQRPARRAIRSKLNRMVGWARASRTAWRRAADEWKSNSGRNRGTRGYPSNGAPFGFFLPAPQRLCARKSTIL